MIVKTHLISGAGNTFHVLYSKDKVFSLNSWSHLEMKEISKLICQQNKADGFIFLDLAQDQVFDDKITNEFKWYFFNNDGSDAEMCGNATRCVGYYIKNILNSEKSEWSLSTIAGTIKIKFISRESFQITMTPLQNLNSSLGFFCDTGVPHLVLEKSEIVMNENIRLEAQKLRKHIDFIPRGTNVTYVVLDQELNKLKAISYERGVENFTAACGTGAAAAAFYNLTKRGVKQTEVEMPGGTLMMDLRDLAKPTMTGPAALLGSFKYEI